MEPDPNVPGLPEGGSQGIRYELLGRLAVGGMAELYLARAHEQNGHSQVVVLKRILPHLAEDPEFVRMFRDEAYLAATLHHPNIVRVYDIGRHGEDYFFTMEYVHGENLRAILRAAQKRGEQIPLEHVLTIAIGVTASLHYAHEQVDENGNPLKIVHRDVSPTNVLVAYDGAVKIVDFGIAKAAAGTHVTQAGMLKGKASYMAPEQCRAEGVDRRSDVFAIGILLFEMTTLTRLFKGDNELAILHQVLSGEVEAPSKRRIGYPPELEAIVLKALESQPEKRYQTAREMQQELERFAQSRGIVPSNPGLGGYLHSLFGSKPLPWKTDEMPAPEDVSELSKVAQTSADQVSSPDGEERGDVTQHVDGSPPNDSVVTPPPAPLQPRSSSPSSPGSARRPPGPGAGRGLRPLPSPRNKGKTVGPPPSLGAKPPVPPPLKPPTATPGTPSRATTSALNTRQGPAKPLPPPRQSTPRRNPLKPVSPAPPGSAPTTPASTAPITEPSLGSARDAALDPAGRVPPPGGTMVPSSSSTAPSLTPPAKSGSTEPPVGGPGTPPKPATPPPAQTGRTVAPSSERMAPVTFQPPLPDLDMPASGVMETQIAGPGSDIGSAAALLRSGQEPAKPSDGSSTPSPTDVPAPTPQSSSEASASQEQPKLAFSAPLPDYDLDDKETQIAVQSTSLPPKPGKPESPTSSFEKTYAAFDLASQEMVEVVDRTQYAPGTGPAGPGEPRTTPEYGTPVTEPFGEAPSSSPETPAGSPQSKPDDSSSDAKSAFAPPVPPPPPGGVKPVAPPAPATGPTTEPSMERPVATPAPSGVTTTEPRTPPAATSQPGAAASSTAKGKTEFAQLPPKPAATGTPGARTGPRDTLFQEPNKPSALTADSPTSKGTTEVVNLSNPPPKVDKTMVAVTDDVRDFLAEAPPVRSEGEDEPATMKWSIDQSNPGMTVVPPSATGPAPPASPSPSSSMSAGPAAPGVPSPSSSLHGDDAGHTVKVTAMTEAEFQAALAEADRPKRRGLMIAAAVLVPLLLGGTAYGIWVASKDDATPTDDETSQSAGADGDDVNAGVAPDDEPPADEDEPPEPAPSTAAPNPDEPPDEPAAESGDTPKDTAEPEDSGSDDTAAPPEQPEPEPNATATPPDEPAIGDAREPQPKPSGGSKPTPVKKKKKKKNKPPPFPGFGPGSRTPP